MSSHNLATISPRRITGLLPRFVAALDQPSYNGALNKKPRLLKAGKSLPALTAHGIDNQYIQVSTVSQTKRAPSDSKGLSARF